MTLFGSDWKNEEEYEAIMFRHWKDDDIGPFYPERDKPEPEHPKSWVTDREFDILPIMYTEEEVRELAKNMYFSGLSYGQQKEGALFFKESWDKYKKK